MEPKKKLDARGDGEYSYDYKNDVMIFKIKNRDYLESLEFENLVIDIDTKGFVTGLRILDATKIFKFSKVALKSIRSFEFNAEVEDKVINIQLSFNTVLRNKPLVVGGQNFNRQALDSDISDSKVLCTVS